MQESQYVANHSWLQKPTLIDAFCLLLQIPISMTSLAPTAYPQTYITYLMHTKSYVLGLHI